MAARKTAKRDRSRYKSLPAWKMEAAINALNAAGKKATPDAIRAEAAKLSGRKRDPKPASKREGDVFSRASKGEFSDTKSLKLALGDATLTNFAAGMSLLRAAVTLGKSKSNGK